jgi:hypothetical protein
MTDVKSNIEIVRQKVAEAAKRSGRNPSEIKIIAVTKTVPIELIEQAIQAGITDLGENRVQEAIPKIEILKPRYPQVIWHMIGHLQRNKVKQALPLFDVIQSLDSERLAAEINDQATTPRQVLVEVNVGGETNKYGLLPAEVIKFLQKLTDFDRIQCAGLMTVAPWFSDQEKARPYFTQLRKLSETIKKLDLPNVEMKYLSMGMTEDFSVAIEEGSNMVRIGRAFFGERGS